MFVFLCGKKIDGAKTYRVQNKSQKPAIFMATDMNLVQEESVWK